MSRNNNSNAVGVWLGAGLIIFVIGYNILVIGKPEERDPLDGMTEGTSDFTPLRPVGSLKLITRNEWSHGWDPDVRTKAWEWAGAYPQLIITCEIRKGEYRIKQIEGVRQKEKWGDGQTEMEYVSRQFTRRVLTRALLWELSKEMEWAYYDAFGKKLTLDEENALLKGTSFIRMKPREGSEILITDEHWAKDWDPALLARIAKWVNGPGGPTVSVRFQVKDAGIYIRKVQCIADSWDTSDTYMHLVVAQYEGQQLTHDSLKFLAEEMKLAFRKEFTKQK